MGKIACPCGNVISDVTEEDMNNKWGYLIKNNEWFGYQKELTKVLSGVIKSYKDGNHREWIKINYPVYTEQSIDSIVSDIISRLDQDIGVSFAECDSCGSLLVQKEGEVKVYTRYMPQKT